MIRSEKLQLPEAVQKKKKKSVHGNFLSLWLLPSDHVIDKLLFSLILYSADSPADRLTDGKI